LTTKTILLKNIFEEILMDISTQVLETKYVINLGQFLNIMLDIKWYIFKPIKFVQRMQPEPACAVVAIDHQQIVIQVQVGKYFIDDVLIDGSSNLTPYNLRMVNQTIAKALGFIRDLKIFIYGISYIVTFFYY